MLDAKNTDAQDSIRLNALRRNAKADLARAIDYALRCGVIGFEQANRISAIVTAARWSMHRRAAPSSPGRCAHGAEEHASSSA